MIPEQSFWHEVAPGAYILDKAEVIWRVLDERVLGDVPHVLLENREGVRRAVPRPNGFTRVTFMRRTMEEVEQMVAERLGARVTARRETAGQWLQAATDRLRGYTVALLADGQALPAGDTYAPEIDVRFLGVTADGAQYQRLDSEGDPFPGPTQLRPWEDVAAIHVY